MEIPTAPHKATPLYTEFPNGIQHYIAILDGILRLKKIRKLLEVY